MSKRLSSNKLATGQLALDAAAQSDPGDTFSTGLVT
jgi:hypothetical protein